MNVYCQLLRKEQHINAESALGLPVYIQLHQLLVNCYFLPNNMKTNQFNYNFSFYIGANLHPKSDWLTKIKVYLINFLIFSYVECFGLIATIVFMVNNWNNKAEIFIVVLQLSAWSCCTFTYLNVFYRQNMINEMFHGIEKIVNERQKLVNDDSYEKTIQKAEKYAKYPMMFFIISIEAISIQPMIYNCVMVLMTGEINTEDWSLPYRYV